MKNKQFISTIFISLLTLFGSLSQAETAVVKGASIKDLAWMTGSWAAQLGPNTLEENWIKPVAGSISSLVRMTGNGKTSMIELIVIEEENDTLVLRIQQWNPGFVARNEKHQTMQLVEIGENKVVFAETESGGMKRLGYSSPAAGQFDIAIETAAGKSMVLNLTAQ